MVIHPRETEIFERKMLEAPGAFIRRDGAAPDVFQEFQQVLAIHTVDMPLNIGESIPQRGIHFLTRQEQEQPDR